MLNSFEAMLDSMLSDYRANNQEEYFEQNTEYQTLRKKSSVLDQKLSDDLPDTLKKIFEDYKECEFSLTSAEQGFHYRMGMKNMLQILRYVWMGGDSGLGDKLDKFAQKLENDG